MDIEGKPTMLQLCLSYKRDNGEFRSKLLFKTRKSGAKILCRNGNTDPPWRRNGNSYPGKSNWSREVRTYFAFVFFFVLLTLFLFYVCLCFYFFCTLFSVSQMSSITSCTFMRGSQNVCHKWVTSERTIKVDLCRRKPVFRRFRRLFIVNEFILLQIF